MTQQSTTNKYQLKPELLAPAGDWKAMQAAVINGADAVYLGGAEFNARANAKNFALEEIKQAVTFCHARGVKVYLTLNTLVKNSELQKFFDTLGKAYAAGVDSIILQHTSFIEIVKRNFPGLQVFVSTQGAIGNTASAQIFKSADRIILPREMPLIEIKKIVAAGLPVEIFVHGALCFSYSGLCLFSSFVANRSGNRGNCAQTCRQKYNGEYPLSTKELCLVRRIPELIRSGITAFKIEGRMRSPLYVAVATRLYRKAIDSFLAGDFQVPKKELDEIEIVFNRDFTEGLIWGEKDIVAPEKPLNRGALLGTVEKGLITLKRPIAKGDGTGIWHEGNISGATINQIFINGQNVDSAPAGETVSLGTNLPDRSNIYLTSSRRISIEPDFKIQRTPFITRRNEVRQIILPRLEKRKAPPLQRFLVKVYSLTEAREVAAAEADIVFYNIFSNDFPDAFVWKERTILGAYVPRILSDAELSRAISLLERKKPGAVLAGNLGLLYFYKSLKMPIFLDYSLNSFNDIDLEFYRRYNAVPILSPELSLAELTSFKNREAVVFCHGDTVVVNTKIKLDISKLIDEKGYEFPVRGEGSYQQILNSRPFGMFNDIRKVRTIGFNQFYIDQKDRSAYFVELYRKMLKEDVPDRRLRQGYTAGHLYRGVD